METVVFGASGGIGSALTQNLLLHPDVTTVHAVSRQELEPRDNQKSYQADIFDEHQLTDLAERISSVGNPRQIIVATGILSDGGSLKPEKTYRHQTLSAFEQVFAINTFGPALIAKHFLPLLPRHRRTVFAALSARVGSISDNRSGGWHAYRASKAALNMLIRNYAIEQRLKNRDSIVVGLHPGTVDTDLSKPFQKSLPDGQIISPEASALALLEVLDGLNAKDSGKLFDWKGKEIPP